MLVPFSLLLQFLLLLLLLPYSLSPFSPISFPLSLHVLMAVFSSSFLFFFLFFFFLLLLPSFSFSFSSSFFFFSFYFSFFLLLPPPPPSSSFFFSPFLSTPYSVPQINSILYYTISVAGTSGGKGCPTQHGPAETRPSPYHTVPSPNIFFLPYLFIKHNTFPLRYQPCDGYSVDRLE